MLRRRDKLRRAISRYNFSYSLPPTRLPVRSAELLVRKRMLGNTQRTRSTVGGCVAGGQHERSSPSQ